MTLSSFRFVASFSLFLIIASASFPANGDPGTSPAKKPNIVLVLIDDMGWSDLSCFGNKAVETPNIDRLADEGIAFTQFHVCMPICSPSRCGITTGQYPQRWRITSYLAHRDFNEERGMAHWLDLDAPTIARFFKQSGYATGHFGKWHLGGQRDVGEAPLITEYGFDESLTNFEGLGPRVLPLCNEFNGKEPRPHDLGSASLGRGEIRWADRNEVTGHFVEKALEFIRKAEEEGKPFYINLWPDDVHSPFFPSKDLRGDGSKKDLYHGVLVEMDRQLAPLFDAIRNSETLRENTLILVMSDNGPEEGAGTSAPLRGNKGMLYEGGTRSPLVVWGQGLQEKSAWGTRNGETVFHSIDLVPSLLDVAGIKTPPEVAFDGENFSDIILGRKTVQDRSAPIFWRRPPDRPGPKNAPLPDLALRDGFWKFLMQFDGSRPQLYDLRKDAGETNNLVDAEPERVESYKRMLLAWNDTLPKDAGEWRGLPGVKLDLDLSSTDDPSDLSGNKNRIEVQGDLPIKEIDGLAGRYFDGTSFLHLPNSISLNCAEVPWSVEVVLNVESENAVILARGGVANGYVLFLESGKPGFAVTIDNKVYRVQAEETIDSWTTLRGSITTSNTLELYIDGRKAAGRKIPGLILNNPVDAMQIGTDTGGQVLHEELPIFKGVLRRVVLSLDEAP